jgi:flagellar hook-associated protein 2
MTMPSSFNVSGLLGGMAGQIDTTALVQQLMQVQALPQTMLKNQLAVQQTTLSAYQAINTKFTALQTAVQGLTDAGAWQVTKATSSSDAVVATSSGSAAAGATTFDVKSLARAQVSTVAADGSGNVVADYTQGITITDSAGVTHNIALTSAAASDVASAINGAGLGVRASVITTDTGTVLQMVASKTGTDAGFKAGGFSSPVNSVVTAANAQIAVGDPLAGGYTITSQSNTFTDAIPGVTFSVNALATGVTVSVDTDVTALSAKVQALVDSANAVNSTIGQASAKGSVLDSNYDVKVLAQSVLSAVSAGAADGSSLKDYGIDLDKDGKISFDAAAFSAAFTADPAKTQSAVNSFATSLNTVVNTAIDPAAGNITAGITSATDLSKDLNDRITEWTSRLADIQTRLQQKYAAMNAALAALQGQSTYLTNMLKSMNTDSSKS